MRTPIPILVAGDDPRGPNVEHMMLWDSPKLTVCGLDWNEDAYAPKNGRGVVLCVDCVAAIETLKEMGR